jgi:hypothetical protein
LRFASQLSQSGFVGRFIDDVDQSRTNLLVQVSDRPARSYPGHKSPPPSRHREDSNLPVPLRVDPGILDKHSASRQPRYQGPREILPSSCGESLPIPPYPALRCRLRGLYLPINPTVLATSPKPEGSTCWISGSVCHFPSFRTAIEVRILSDYTRRSLGLKCYLSQYCDQSRDSVAIMGRFD